MNTPRHARRARGFTLVEALVALLALSIGLLGVAAMQMVGLRANVGAAVRSQATYLAYDIIDRMRANRDDAANGLYQVASIMAANPDGSTPSSLDLKQWKQSLTNTLPAGSDATINVDASAPPAIVVSVTITWYERALNKKELTATGTAAGTSLTFATNSQI
jgi:type IV pilus assembly protein PilV